MMRSKKAWTGADFLSFVIWGIGGTFIIIGFILFAFIPLWKSNIEYKIESKMEDSQYNLFLLYYLDYPVNGDNIASIISYSHLNNDHVKLKAQTNLALKKLYGEDIAWKIIIDNKEVVNNCDIVRCKGYSETYGTKLPIIGQNIISFKIEIFPK